MKSTVLEFESFLPPMNWWTEQANCNQMHVKMIKKKFFQQKNTPQARLIK